MGIIHSAFCPAWWLPGPHLQTVAPVLARPRPPLDVVWERLELPDGDFLDLAWTRPAPPDPSAPVLILWSGLGGSIDSKYARGLLREAGRRGWRGVLAHFRGTSGTPNRRARAYHAGEVEDPRCVLRHVRARYPRARLASVGFSLGGSVLLNLLGEGGAEAGLCAAAAVSVPLELAPCARRLQRGLSRIYDRYLLADLKAKLRARAQILDLGLGVIDPRALRSVEDFDDAVTAPLHGFDSASDYYTRSSCRSRLGRIDVPTLVVQALDDPFLTPEILPEAHELSPEVTLELARGGGHVGFVAGAHPARPRYWLEERLPAFLAPYLEG